MVPEGKAKFRVGSPAGNNLCSLRLKHNKELI